MAWSETMFIIQHFYNMLDIENRLFKAEHKFPLLSKSIEGLPELPIDTAIEDLAPGLLWFIQDDSTPSKITGVSILQDDYTFAEPIPLQIDLNNMPLDEDIKQIINDMGLTSDTYSDVIRTILDVLKSVPVKYGGTGITDIAENEVLVGGADNTFKKVGIDNVLTENSNNLITSGAVQNALNGVPVKSHASENTTYGIGTDTLYGHVKLTDSHSSTNAGVALSAKGAKDLYDTLNTAIGNIDTSGDVPTNHAATDTTYGAGDSTHYGHVKLTDSYSSTTINTALSASGAKSLYDSLNSSVSGKAPTNHANSNTTYGVGTNTVYGHLKISNDYNPSSVTSGAALSQSGAKSMYTSLNSSINGKAPINHASSQTTYGIGTSGNYGHLKISDNYNLTTTDTALSVKGANNLYTALKGATENIQSGDTLPVKIEILSTVVSNVTVPAGSTSVTLANYASIETGALYLLDYKCYLSDSTQTLEHSGYAIARTLSDYNSKLEWFTENSGYGITLEGKTLTDSYRDHMAGPTHSGWSSVISVYKIQINTIDGMQKFILEQEGFDNISGGNYSHAEGLHTVASGKGSHAEGYKSKASGEYSHAEGCNSTASGNYSHAEGYNGSAFGNYSHASSGVAQGDYSYAMGDETTATGMLSYARGWYAKAIGDYSHAEGYHIEVHGEHGYGCGSGSSSQYMVVKGDYAHAEGYLTGTNGAASHAEGSGSHSNGNYSHAEGHSTTAAGQGSHTEGDYTSTGTSASSAHAEGSQTEANGIYSHAEGRYTIASGEASHAEGEGDSSVKNTASGKYSHAEGRYTTASGQSSHAEGEGTTSVQTKASGDRSHAEGYCTTASGTDTHAEGNYTKAQYSCSHAEGYRTTTGTSSTAAHAEGYYTSVSGNYGHAEGYYTVASGLSSHAEGSGSSTTKSTAQGAYSHVEGYINQANGQASHAEGSNNIADAYYSHAEGNLTKASGYCSHAEGIGLSSEPQIASGEASHVEGAYNQATGDESHVEGQGNVASGTYSHVEGYSNTASGDCSHAGGTSVTARNFACVAFGQWNKPRYSTGSDGNPVGDALLIGNGETSDRNAFRVSFEGDVYGMSSYHSSNADYAEYFEWEDGNPNNEDRVGHFVTVKHNKISIAKSGDYILGIVSGQPCIIGNADEDWLGRMERDEFNRFIIEEKEIPVMKPQLVETEILDENGKPTGEMKQEVQKVPTGEIRKVTHYKENPNYDPTQEYIERKDRPEWSAIGMLGVLSVYEDGTCQIDGFCKVTDNGTGTAANSEFIIENNQVTKAYRVVERVTDNIVRVIFR